MNKYFRIGSISGTIVLTSLLSILSLALYLIFPSFHRLLIFFAMFFSSIGDLFMMGDGVKDRKNGMKRLVLGASSFMIAHFLYFFAYASRAADAFGGFNFGFIFTASVFIIFLSAVIYLRFKFKSSRRVLLLAIVYLSVICIANLGVSLAAFSLKGTLFISLIGSLSFMISDMIIGLDILGGIKKYNKYIWWLYPIGQLLLIIFG